MESTTILTLIKQIHCCIIAHKMNGCITSSKIIRINLYFAVKVTITGLFHFIRWSRTKRSMIVCACVGVCVCVYECVRDTEIESEREREPHYRVKGTRSVHNFPHEKNGCTAEHESTQTLV